MDLRQWNECLVQAVFFAPLQRSPTITRINATDSFLAEAGGFSSGTEARESFLSAMPKTASRVIDLFSPPEFRSWKISDDSLPFYAQLHLTILAASADELVHDEGDFRKRLAKMLELVGTVQLSGRALPKLWEKVQSWSQYRSENIGDVRRLILPNPGAETIIGYSKQLAFPSYVDQKYLAEIFSDSDIDDSSPLYSIIQSIRHNTHKFSYRFLEEYRRFTRQIELRKFDDAANSPFWDVVQETNWTAERSSSKQGKQGFSLEIDITDPTDLAIWLHTLVSDQPRTSSENDDSIQASICPTGSTSAAGSLLEELQAKSMKKGAITEMGSALYRAVKAGCIGFNQADDGRWLSTPAPAVNDYAWLVVHRDLSWLFDMPRASKKELPRFLSNLPGSSHWKAFGPIRVTPKILEWVNQKSSVPDFFSMRLTHPRISISGTVGIKGGRYLFSHLLPIKFALKEAYSGSISLLSNDGVAQPPVSLAECNSGLCLPSSFLQPNIDTFSTLVSLRSESGEFLSKGVFKFSTQSLVSNLKPVRNIHSWLIDGWKGHLTDYETLAITTQSEAIIQNKESTDTYRPLQASSKSTQPPSFIPIHKLPPQWDLTLECFAAIFERRYALSFNEAIDLLCSIWGTKKNAWDKLESLLANCVLGRVYNKSWSGSLLVAVQPTITVCHDGMSSLARIVGLTSRLMRSIASHELKAVDSSFITSPDGDTFGAIECRIGEDVDFKKTQLETGWNIQDSGCISNLYVPPTNCAFSHIARQDLTGFSEEGKSVWSKRLGYFVDDLERHKCEPRLERWQSGNQQDLYVLFRKDGSSWNTNSRFWGLLALAHEERRHVGFFLEEGGLLIESTIPPLPPSVLYKFLTLGSGVCYRDPDGNFRYSKGHSWNPNDSFSNWVEHPLCVFDRKQKYNVAKKRYNFIRNQYRQRTNRWHE